MSGIDPIVLLILAGFAISVLVIGGYAVIWYFLIRRVEDVRIRMLIPIVLAAILIISNPLYDTTLWSSVSYQQFVALGGLLTIFRIIPLLTIIAMAAILPFLFAGQCIGARRSWVLIAIASGTGFFITIAEAFP